MARPLKQGLDYFPYDVDLDQDDKLGMIVGEYGEKGETLFTKILCWIYKHEGYFMKWDEDVQLRFLRRYSYCGFSVSFIKEVVPRFIKWGLFDKAVFDAFQTLTSARIQKTWLDASRKRNSRVVLKNIWLIEIVSSLQVEEIKLKAEETNQSKVNEIKVNQSKPKPNGVAAEKPPRNKEKKNKETPEPYWDKLVAAWFDFNSEKFSIKPSFKEQDPKFLKTIVEQLKKRSANENIQWTEEVALKIVKNFFCFAYTDQWLKKHFLLKNLNEQFDKIIQLMVSDSSTVRKLDKTVLTKSQRETNYMYESYQEGKNVINHLSDEHFDLLKKLGLSFSDLERVEIKEATKKYLTEQGLTVSDDGLKSLQKRFGIIQFFKQQKSKGNATIFRLD